MPGTPAGCPISLPWCELSEYSVLVLRPWYVTPVYYDMVHLVQSITCMEPRKCEETFISCWNQSYLRSSCEYTQKIKTFPCWGDYHWRIYDKFQIALMLQTMATPFQLYPPIIISGASTKALLFSSNKLHSKILQVFYLIFSIIFFNIIVFWICERIKIQKMLTTFHFQYQGKRDRPADH